MSDRFAQIDFALVPQRWRHSIMDAQSLFEASASSDHAMLLARGCVRLKAPDRTPKPERICVTHLGVAKWCDKHIKELSRDACMDDFVRHVQDTLTP